MTQLIILLAIVLVPVLMIMIIRANAAIAFMSLCVGSVLVTYTASDVTSTVSSFSSKVSPVTTQWVQLGLLLVPFVLAMLFTRASIHGSKQVTNFLPAVASGLLFALLAIPLFSSSWQHQLEAQGFWHQISSLQTAVVLGGAAFSLLFILISHRTSRGGSGHGKS